MIQTLSQFYYGHEITEDNQYIDFKESGGSEISAAIPIGSYSLTDFLSALENVLNSEGTLDYTVSVVRSTRIVTIAVATGTVQILAATGTHASTGGVYSLLGFSLDSSNSASVSGTLSSGSVWRPQFKAQSWRDFDQNQSAIDGVKRESTSGQVEAVSFGNKKIMDANFMFITNIYQSAASPIENDSDGYESALAFLEYAIGKSDMEWMPDRDVPNTFTKVLLESSPSNKDGLGFELNELYGKGLPGYYETGVLKFRGLT